MQKSQTNLPKGGIGVQDILFIVFKHKWMILLLTMLGLGASAFLYVRQEAVYQSKAKLLVRYVRETGAIDPYAEMKFTSGATIGANSVISTEFEILNSLDLALEVAEAVGADRLIRTSNGGRKAELVDAAAVIQKGLEVSPGQSGNMLYVTYGNANPKLTKETLDKIIDLYFKKHLDIHRSKTAFDIVAKQTEEVRERLKETERQLNKARTDSGILSLSDATTTLSAIRARTNEELMRAKAELAEQQASIQSIEKVIGRGDDSSVAPDPSDQVSQGREMSLKGKASPPPQEAITQYRAVTEVLAFLQKRDLELKVKFKSGNRLLSLNQQQIDINEANRRSLVARYPNLTLEAAVADGNARNPRLNLVNEKARLASIAAKIAVYEAHLTEIGSQIGEQIAIGSRIEELERTKQMEDEEYRSLEAKLKDARINETLDPSRMPNITVLEHPASPIKTYNPKIKMLIFGLAGAGLVLGLGIAFLIELVFDRRVKRPMEIQARLQLPLLLAIPYIRRKDRGGLLLAHESSQRLIGSNGNANLLTMSDNQPPDPASLKTSHFILPYSETIRDRTIFNFEINNVTHKPKLVAVTGLSAGAGTSTIAAGLAKSFSEIPGMKILLVDLSSVLPEENPLFGEIPRHSLNGALHLARNTQFRENPQNLYYASATARRDDSGLTTFSPMHLYELMPHLQASEYDYIVFDMPPIDQTSRTLTMAGLMDKVLLVLDAENTSRDALKWGYSELVKGKADVSCVFNKTRSHVPGWVIGKA